MNFTKCKIHDFLVKEYKYEHQEYIQHFTNSLLLHY
ncbi:hypothetical protein SAMN06265349_101235 [Flavobacterium resistens]|uniref:Uncharacterized protein n=1 Tax=Flavobacterium resistens TaxID=443612 RepID=A0A521AMV4_9FLAO|nr:hypothetical protein SAMN06265349_101235 [Flavobacterium resistens]